MAIRAIAAWKPNAHILVITTKKQVDSHAWDESIDSYNQNVDNAHVTYDVYNYEALNSKTKRQTLTKSLKSHAKQPLFVVADEAHRIKNSKSNNFKHVVALTRLSNFQATICLTATPITESLLDTQDYLILAGYYKNKTQFMHEHVTRYDNYFQPLTKDRAGVIHNEWLNDYETIIKRFKSIQVHISTKALLPTVKYSELKFSFDKDTQKAYRKIKKDYVNGMYESIAAANADQRKFVAEHDEQRRAALSNIISNPSRPAGPILIFYQYNAERDSLRDYLPNAHPDYHLFEINGANKYDTRIEPPEKSLFLCQYTASGEALNAQWSHVSVFYAPTYSWEKFKQARGRNTRAYQGGTTYHIRFIVLKTINEHYWYDLIDNKKAFTTNLMSRYLTNDD